ncbi:L,D-transpeptidase family protein [Carboxylicivirga sp. RSCT41]|uniref:L,D-transpeptidase family protein n=1 Tax=Carboxylicivirga agarovorans TaxID=3417570 RepID=UPI003D33C711
MVFIFGIVFMHLHAWNSHVIPYCKLDEPVSMAISTHQSNRHLKELVLELHNSGGLKLKGQLLLANRQLIETYKKNNFQPLWLNERNRQDLLFIVTHAYYDGLNPEDYHADYIRQNVIKYRGRYNDPYHIAVADIIMSDALLTYRTHLINGKLDQTSLQPMWSDTNAVVKDELLHSLQHHLRNTSLSHWMNNARPHLKRYEELKSLFARYDSIHKGGGHLEKLKYPGSSLKPGDSIPEVSELKKHLIANAYSSLDTTAFFNGELEEAIKDVQILNGIEADGVAGKETYRAINITIKERLDILRVNMERLRWLNNQLPEDYLIVNIASFYLHLVRNDTINHYCRVVVGKDHKQTPTFRANVSYIVFNPTWHIPYSIVSQEILPKLKQDDNFLKDRNMILYQNNTPIDPAKVDFTQYSSHNFPYAIVQQPGSRNALGKVKFMFASPYAIYLHDTPSKSLFNRSERAFSHGCIRVEKPFVLAKLLLNDPYYDLQRINKIVESETTQTIHLKERIPIILIYMTCDDNKNDGRISFYKDIYGRDKRLLEALESKR